MDATKARWGRLARSDLSIATRGMSWIPFGLTAVVAVILQTTVVQQFAIRGVGPDWAFIVAMHYALRGPGNQALIAGWAIGLLMDLNPANPLRVGVFSLTYGVSVWLALRVRRAVFPDHPLAQVLLTFLLAAGVQVIAGLVANADLRNSPLSTGAILGYACLSAVYTAIWAPLLLWPLGRFRRWTGLPATRTRRSHRRLP